MVWESGARDATATSHRATAVSQICYLDRESIIIMFIVVLCSTLLNLNILDIIYYLFSVFKRFEALQKIAITTQYILLI